MKKQIKVVIYGKMWSGKSNLMNILSGDNIFIENYRKTIGVDHKRTVYKNIILNYWDLAGDPKYECLISSYFYNSDIILLVYDCRNIRESFMFVKKFYYNNIHLFQNKKVILVGNKYDIYDSRYIYNVYEFCEENKIPNFYTSCKTKHGIKNLVNYLLLDNSLYKIDEETHDKNLLHTYSELQKNTNKYNCCVLL